MVCDNLWHNSEMLSSFLEESRIAFKAQRKKNDLDLLEGHIYTKSSFYVNVIGFCFIIALKPSANCTLT